MLYRSNLPFLLYTADINECEGFNDCEHVCVNTDGSFTCSCNPGFTLAIDEKRCIGERVKYYPDHIRHSPANACMHDACCLQVSPQH